MKYRNILLTGSTGQLGQAIIASQCFPSILTPSIETMDITKPLAIAKFFKENDIDVVIHCAALARMAECERDPARAVDINIAGTANLCIEVMKKEKETAKSIRFIYISTDAVYAGKKGNYSEQDETIPYNNYGWTKLGGECAVKLVSNHCIIRTSFFNPANIRFDNSATDAFSSKVPVGYLVKAIEALLELDFIGTINIGGKRKSDYERYREFKPQLKSCKLRDILKDVPFRMASDASLDSSLWKRIEKKKEAT